MGCVYLIEGPTGKGYVGMTKGSAERRFARHVLDSQKNRSLYLHNALRLYGVSNFTVTTLTESDDPENLKQLEKLFIVFFQTHAPKGYNLTSGGDGITGYVRTEKDIQAISKAQRKRYSDPVQLEKLRNQGRAAANDPEVRKRAQMSASAIKRSPEFRKRASETSKRLSSDPARKAASSARFKAMWQDPEKRAALSEKLRAIKRSPEFRAKASAKAKELWNNQALREKTLAGIVSRDTPEWRDQLRKAHLGKKRAPASESRKAKIRAAQLASWANPETRARREKAIAPARERSMADPLIRAKISAGVKKLWENPEYRAARLAKQTP